jgi:phage baseplate assembly protein W
MPIFNFGSRRQPTPPAPPKIAPGAEVRLAFADDKYKGGRNIKFPLERDKKGDFVSVSGVDLNTQKVIQVLATRARTSANPGDLAGTPEFGSRLHLLNGRTLDEATRKLAEVLAREAINIWLPDIQVVAVDVVLVGVDTDDKRAGVSITLQYRVTSERTTGELAEITLIKRT